MQALQSAQRSRKVLAVAPVVAQAAPVVGPEAVLAAARALVPGLAAQAQAVLELEMAAQAEPAAAADITHVERGGQGASSPSGMRNETTPPSNGATPRR
ncbi:hypothetical protein ACVWZL_005233 [Bradyrhizobium sp. GM2.4]